MKIKKISIVLCTSVILAAIAILILNALAEQKITRFLENEFDAGQLVHGNVHANLLSGNAEIDSVVFRNENLKIELKSLEIQNFGYADFFWDEQLTIEKIYVDSPKIELRESKNESAQNKKDTLRNGKKPKLKKLILVENIEIKKGSALIFENKKDTLLHVENFSAKIDSVRVSSSTLQQNIPFEHKKHRFNADSVYFSLNKYHELTVVEVEVSDEKIFLQNLLLFPKYSRSEFRAVIPYEKDMFNLKIVSWKIERPFFDFFAEKPIFKSSMMTVENVSFKAYRDKTVTDDPRTKKMYNEMLRDLPFRIDIEKTLLRNVFIQYQERIQKDRSLGTVAFYDLNAEVTDLTNLNWKSENFPITKLNIDTRFMNTSDLHVNWEMDVGSERDHFTISGQAKKIPPKAMNPFFVPAMRIKAKGGIDALYFNFEGDYIDAVGDLRMNYSNFSVEVLKKDEQEKNKFLSVIANIFVKANPKNGTVSTENIHVERDPTKSFWNYFWSCIEKGLRKSVL